MSVLPILTFPDDLLRKKALPIKEITPEILKLLDDMAETMYDEPGIGLAATQVGALHRAIVVDVGDDEETGRKARLYKIINPEYLYKEGKIETEEGCLSLPEIREFVKRAERVGIKGINEKGEPIELETDGLLAVCLQHEIDHLDGVLFIDHISRLKRTLAIKHLKKLKQNT